MKNAVIILVASLGLEYSIGLCSGTQDHLQPIAPYDICCEGYHQSTFQLLIHPSNALSWVEFWMMVFPSFRPEYAVVLRSVTASDTVKVRYELEYAIASEPVWRWKTLDSGRMKLDLQRDVPVDRKTAPLADTVATLLISIWQSTIRQTKYADQQSLGLDGVTYEFYARPDLYGETWSPKSGTPQMIVDLGSLLISYVTANEKKRDSILQEILELSRKLQAQLE